VCTVTALNESGAVHQVYIERVCMLSSVIASFQANVPQFYSHPVSVLLIYEVFPFIIFQFSNSLAFDHRITVSSNMHVISNCCSNHLEIMMTVDIFQYKSSAVLLKCGGWS
jgi:hypothetical protein